MDCKVMPLCFLRTQSETLNHLTHAIWFGDLSQGFINELLLSYSVVTPSNSASSALASDLVARTIPSL